PRGSLPVRRQALEQRRESRIVPQAVEHLVIRQPRDELPLLVERALEPLEGELVLAERGVDAGDVVRGHVALPRKRFETLGLGERLLATARDGVSLPGVA